MATIIAPGTIAPTTEKAPGVTAVTEISTPPAKPLAKKDSASKTPPGFVRMKIKMPDGTTKVILRPTTIAEPKTGSLLAPQSTITKKPEAPSASDSSTVAPKAFVTKAPNSIQDTNSGSIPLVAPVLIQALDPKVTPTTMMPSEPKVANAKPAVVTLPDVKDAQKIAGATAAKTPAETKAVITHSSKPINPQAQTPLAIPTKAATKVPTTKSGASIVGTPAVPAITEKSEATAKLVASTAQTTTAKPAPAAASKDALIAGKASKGGWFKNLGKKIINTDVDKAIAGVDKIGNAMLKVEAMVKGDTKTLAELNNHSASTAKSVTKSSAAPANSSKTPAANSSTLQPGAPSSAPALTAPTHHAPVSSTSSGSTKPTLSASTRPGPTALTKPAVTATPLTSANTKPTTEPAHVTAVKASAAPPNTTYHTTTGHNSAPASTSTIRHNQNTYHDADNIEYQHGATYPGHSISRDVSNNTAYQHGGTYPGHPASRDFSDDKADILLAGGSVLAGGAAGGTLYKGYEEVVDDDDEEAVAYEPWMDQYIVSDRQVATAAHTEADTGDGDEEASDDEETAKYEPWMDQYIVKSQGDGGDDKGTSPGDEIGNEASGDTHLVVMSGSDVDATEENAQVEYHEAVASDHENQEGHQVEGDDEGAEDDEGPVEEYQPWMDQYVVPEGQSEQDGGNGAVAEDGHEVPAGGDHEVDLEGAADDNDGSAPGDEEQVHHEEYSPHEDEDEEHDESFAHHQQHQAEDSDDDDDGAGVAQDSDDDDGY